MSTTSVIDSAKVEAFVGKVMADSSATFVTTLAALGDRLGLFKTLASGGPATSAEFASRAGIDERYAREWLGGMTTAGYLTHDPDTGRFALPAEHAPALAEEGGPFFFGGAYQMLLALAKIHDPLTDAFRHGGGVPQAAYDDALLGRDGAIHGRLVQQPPRARVDAGDARRAGEARAGRRTGRRRLRTWPSARAPRGGVSRESVRGLRRLRAQRRGRPNACRRGGVADRVHFEVRDAAQGATAPVRRHHDLRRGPRRARSARTAAIDSRRASTLTASTCASTPTVPRRSQENNGPMGSLFHGISILYCMTTSLANGGAGLGNARPARAPAARVRGGRRIS